MAVSLSRVSGTGLFSSITKAQASSLKMGPRPLFVACYKVDARRLLPIEKVDNNHER